MTLARLNLMLRLTSKMTITKAIILTLRRGIDRP